jgi:hypothetical protein
MADSDTAASPSQSPSEGESQSQSVEELKLELKGEGEIQEESESSDDDDSFDEEERGFGDRSKVAAGRGGVKFRSERSLATVKLMSDRHDRVYDDWADVGFFLRYWEIEFAQSKTLTGLRDRLKDVKSPLNRPGVVVRFLVQEKFHLAKAEKRFRDMIAWRIKCPALQTGYAPPPDLLEKYPGAILKDTDNDDDPIFVSRLGVTDLAGLTTTRSDELFNYDVFRREFIMKAGSKWQADWSLKAGRPFRDILIIEDLHHLSSKGIPKAIAAIFGAAELDQTYYPRLAKEIVIIRAPAQFRAAFTLSKRTLPKAIREKIHVYGTSDYLEKLQKYMAVESLPPCINPKGKGECLEGLSPSLDGRVYM